MISNQWNAVFESKQVKKLSSWSSAVERKAKKSERSEILAIIGPIVIKLSLLKVSGIPLQNRRFETQSEYPEHQK